MATAMEILTQEFNSLLSEAQNKAHHGVFMARDDYQHRFREVIDRLHDETGLCYDMPLITLLYVDFQRQKA